MERKTWHIRDVIIHKNGYVNVAYPSQWEFIRKQMPWVWVGADKIIVNEDFGGEDLFSRHIHRKRMIYRKATV